MKRRLPIGIQDFPKIREGGFCYVDKTERIHELISGSGGCFFLSRPRRFGKSLLCSTLGAIFEGRRELFGEIAGYPALGIDSLEWDWKRHPVIRIDLNAGAYSGGVEALRSVLARELKREAEKQELLLGETDVITQFTSLIQKSCDKTGEKAVIIIDEYDKPLLSTIDLPDIHKEIRDELKGFYGVLKSYDAYLKFVFLTGVTKFAHISVFSDLNHLVDLTLNPQYADLCGITQEELECEFTPEIEFVLQDTGKDKDVLLQNCFVFCIPSTVEGLSITLLEAMSFERPVLASDIPANREVLGNAGIWVKPENVDDLSEKLIYCEKNVAVLESQKALNYQRVAANYTWNKIAKKYVSYLNSLL